MVLERLHVRWAKLDAGPRDHPAPAGANAGRARSRRRRERTMDRDRKWVGRRDAEGARRLFSGPRPEERRLWRRVSKDAPERAGNGCACWIVLRDARFAGSSGRGAWNLRRPAWELQGTGNGPQARKTRKPARLRRSGRARPPAPPSWPLSLCRPGPRPSGAPQPIRTRSGASSTGRAFPTPKPAKAQNPASGSISPGARRRAWRSSKTSTASRRCRHPDPRSQAWKIRRCWRPTRRRRSRTPGRRSRCSRPGSAARTCRVKRSRWRSIRNGRAASSSSTSTSTASAPRSRRRSRRIGLR